MNLPQILLKLLVGALVLVVYTRLTGRSQITPLSATDVVSSIVVGAIISESLFEETVPLWAVVLMVALWTAVFMGLREWKTKRIRAELLLDGKAVQLVEGGRLVEKSFNAANLTLRDFETLVHQQGIGGLEELHNVWFEPTGQISIVKKGEEGHSVHLVENGQVYKENLGHIDKDEAWLEEELAGQGAALKEVFCAEWHKGRLWVYKK